MEQEQQEDDAQGERATPSTLTTTTTREGRQRPADSDDLGSPRSRGQAPSALPPSPTHTVYSAEQEPMTQCRKGTPALPAQPGPKGGRRQGRERQAANWNRNQTEPRHNVPTTGPAPQTKPQAP